MKRRSAARNSLSSIGARRLRGEGCDQLDVRDLKGLEPLRVRDRGSHRTHDRPGSTALPRAARSGSSRRGLRGRDVLRYDNGAPTERLVRQRAQNGHA